MRALILALLLCTGPVAAQTSCPDLGWGRYLVPGPQSFALRERIPLPGGREIGAIAFDALAGDYAKIFLFLVYRGECLEAAVVHGSYAFTQTAAPEGTRIYHTDLYERFRHTTLGMYEQPLSYDVFRALALGALGVGGR